MTKPKAAANEITRLLQLVLGEDAYPVPLGGVIHDYLNDKFQDEKITLYFRPLDNIEGALVPSADGQWTILINSNIESNGRRNFTLAHEIGHYILHRNGGERQCAAGDTNNFSESEFDPEFQANQFASQLLLPPNIVRPYTELPRFDIETLIELSEKTETSLTAAAMAYISVSRHPVAMAVVKDGFVSWGRASDKAFARGIKLWKGREVPKSSRCSGEFDENFRIDPEEIEGWFFEHKCVESGYCSRKYGTLMCLDFRISL